MPPALGSVEDRDLVAERGRSRATVSEAAPPPMQAMRLPFLRAAGGRRGGDVVLVVGGDALQAADRDRLLLDAAAAAGRLAGAVAGAARECRERRSTSS
jgi:hypothetical protein